jgi:hypothetical protein
MSLALNPASLDEQLFQSNMNQDDNYIQKKKQTHNKTQKKNVRENFNNDKVNSVLQKIYNEPEQEDDNLGDFNPPPNPQSSGVDRRILTENMKNMGSEGHNIKNMFTYGQSPQPIYEKASDLDLNNYTSNLGDESSVEEYYKKFLPNYISNQHKLSNSNPMNMEQLKKQILERSGTGFGIGAQAQAPGGDVLLQKLNYMIHLLEEQQDQKTNNVTEEIILYSFLGIFIIFVVDSFARVGKYVR